MRNVITQFPILISAVFVLITGVVFAQVLPEEPLVESPEEVIVDTPDVVIEPEVATSSGEVTAEANIASSTEEVQVVDAELSSSTATVATDTPLVEVATEEEIKNTVFTAADEVNSLRDLERPQQCQTDGAKAFFDTIGECVRFVTAKISESKREPFEDKLSEQPRETFE